jgi:hypothetical protein
MNIETFQLTENERSDSSTDCQALDFHCFRGREETSLWRYLDQDAVIG